MDKNLYNDIVLANLDYTDESYKAIQNYYHTYDPFDNSEIVQKNINKFFK